MLRVLKKDKKLISSDDLLLLTEKVVLKYMFAGTIPKKEVEDVKMAIVEKFLLKEKQITSGFNGDSKVTTYCISILNRMCCEIIRRDLKHWKVDTTEKDSDETTSHLNASEKLIIADEINLLKKILVLQGVEQFKIIVFLAFYYQFPPKENTVSKYDKLYIKNKLLELLEVKESISKGEIFDILAEIANKVENKKNKPDAVRMWLNKAIESLISRLNGPFARAAYNKESLQILFEYYYFENDIKPNQLKNERVNYGK